MKTHFTYDKTQGKKHFGLYSFHTTLLTIQQTPKNTSITSNPLIFSGLNSICINGYTQAKKPTYHNKNTISYIICYKTAITLFKGKYVKCICKETTIKYS